MQKSFFLVFVLMWHLIALAHSNSTEKLHRLLREYLATILSLAEGPAHTVLSKVKQFRNQFVQENIENKRRSAYFI